jgi:hypothetical protein
MEDYWRRPYHMAYGDLLDFWGPHLWLIQFLFFNSMIRLFYLVSTVSININIVLKLLHSMCHFHTCLAV